MTYGTTTYQERSIFFSVPPWGLPSGSGALQAGSEALPAGSEALPTGSEVEQKREKRRKSPYVVMP